MVKPRDIAGMWKKKKNGEAQRYSWERGRRRRMVKPRDIAGNEEEECRSVYFRDTEFLDPHFLDGLYSYSSKSPSSVIYISS